MLVACFYLFLLLMQKVTLEDYIPYCKHSNICYKAIYIILSQVVALKLLCKIYRI